MAFTLSGIVLDSKGHNPMSDIVMELLNSNSMNEVYQRATTDARGVFTMADVPDQNCYVRRAVYGGVKPSEDIQIILFPYPPTDLEIRRTQSGPLTQHPAFQEFASDPPLTSTGKRELAADWDAGAFKITAKQLESDVADGTPPFIVASTTEVANLKAEDSGKLGGVADTGYAKLANANVFTADQSVADDTKFAFGSGSNAALGWSSASSELQLISDSDTLMFDAGATDVGFGWATSGQLDFKVGSNIEMSLTVNELTFNTGATDVALGWTSSGQLDFKIGSTNEMGLVSNKLSFFSGFSPAFLQWSTDGKLEFGIASGVEMDLTASGLNIVDACRASMFRADTSSTGVAGTNTWGGTTLSANPLGTRPSIDRLPTGYLTAASAGWIKIHVGTSEAVIPYWAK